MADELETAEETTIPEEGVVEESAEIQGEEEVSEVEGPSAEEIAEQAEVQRKMDEHKANSKLGRKFTDLQAQMLAIAEENREILKMMSNPKKTVELDEGEYATVGSIKAILKQQEEEKAELAREQSRTDMIYARGYETELQNIADEVDDEDTHIQVMKLVTEDGSKYNVRSSNDPSAAAQINYNRALRSLKTGSKPTLKANLKGDKNLPPAGGKTKTGAKAEKEIVFSAEQLDYLARTNTSVEEAKKLMKV